MHIICAFSLPLLLFFFLAYSCLLLPCLFLFTLALLVVVVLFTLALLVLLPLFMIHGVSSLMNNIIIHTLGFGFVCVLCRW